nr:glycosyltransferase family 4 protein [uncultured Draconibacterium sp.]
MQKINWIILKSKDRGTCYGVGTFIKQLSIGLTKKDNINVYILEIGTVTTKFFGIYKRNGITILEIPLPYEKKNTDTKNNQEKLAKNLSRIVSQYIPERSLNIIHMNYTFQYFIAISLKNILNGKLIFTQHLFLNNKISETNNFDIESQTYKDTDHIIAISEQSKIDLLKNDINSKKVEIIYNGSGPFTVNNKVDIREKYDIPNKDKIIVFSGRIDPIKGLSYLCKAMENLIRIVPNCYLVIAGDGKDSTLDMLSDNFPNKVKHLGYIPFEDVISLYTTANVGVIPSIEEPFGYVALEMMHCGLPIVASNIGGLKEILIHNENALLVDMIPDKTNFFGIAPHIIKLEHFIFQLINDKPLRIKLSRNAKIRAESMFSSSIMAENYIKLTNKRQN